MRAYAPVSCVLGSQFHIGVDEEEKRSKGSGAEGERVSDMSPIILCCCVRFLLGLPPRVRRMGNDFATKLGKRLAERSSEDLRGFNAPLPGVPAPAEFLNALERSGFFGPGSPRR